MQLSNHPPALSAEEIQCLYEKYLLLVTLEVEKFRVKPTEVRHLIGRLGEFHCAKEVEGTLALQANQRGYDVVSKTGRKISVKTTAQKTGFIPISKTTIKEADDLMVIQYANGKLSIIYYGCIKKATDREYATYYPGVKRYNLSIAKARSLALIENAP